MSAAATLGSCLEFLTHATADQRASAVTSLELIRQGQIPFSTVLRLERAVLGVGVTGGDLQGADLARLPPAANACAGTLQLERGPKARLSNGLLMPTWCRKLVDLERISVTDPLLESPAVRAALENSPLEDWLQEPPSEYPRFARRYANVSRKTDALLALLQALDGRTPPTYPWMKLSVTDAHVHLEVLLDEGWKTFDVDR